MVLKTSSPKWISQWQSGFQRRFFSIHGALATHSFPFGRKKKHISVPLDFCAPGLLQGLSGIEASKRSVVPKRRCWWHAFLSWVEDDISSLKAPEGTYMNICRVCVLSGCSRDFENHLTLKQ